MTELLKLLKKQLVNMCIYSGIGVHHSVYALGSSGIVQFIVSVLVLVVVIVLCYFTTRFIANYQKGIVGKGNIEILEAKSLGNNKYIEIIRIGEECFALGVAKDNITFISKVDRDTLKYEQPQTNKTKESFSQLLDKLKNGRYNNK